MREPDATFADPRQAVLYDLFDHDRSDLDAYVAIIEEFDAHGVIDIGCGTGCLAVRLAENGIRVIAVDAAAASLDVARAKPYADRVTWVHADATALDGLVPEWDLAVMTGNVAQVFVDDADWMETLRAIRRALRPEGRLVFETRRPEARDWENWAKPPTPGTLPDGREVVTDLAVDDSAYPLVSLAGSVAIDREILRSSSTLRFRTLSEIDSDLGRAGFVVTEVRDAPDRPGKEYVVLAQRGRAARHRA